MRRDEGEVEKERLPAVPGGVFVEEINGVLGNGGRGVEAVTGFRCRQGLVVQEVRLGREVAVVVLEPVRMIEAAREHLAIHMPFARMIAAISRRLEELRQQRRPHRPLLRWIAIHLLRVVAGHETRPRRPAARRVIHLGQAQAARSKSVEIGCRNLAAVAADVRKAQIVREDENDVRFCRFGSSADVLNKERKTCQNRN